MRKLLLVLGLVLSTYLCFGQDSWSELLCDDKCMMSSPSFFGLVKTESFSGEDSLINLYLTSRKLDNIKSLDTINPEAGVYFYEGDFVSSNQDELFFCAYFRATKKS